MIKNHLPENCYSKHDMENVRGAVVHHISAVNVDPENPFNLDEIINIFKKYKVSAHALIERDGTIIELVPENHKAYHAGYSIFNDVEKCNNFMLGVELVGGPKWEFTSEQIISLAEWLGQKMTKHQFTLDWVTTHKIIRSNWNENHPEKQASKKYDIADNFKWEILNDMLYSVDSGVRYKDSRG